MAADAILVVLSPFGIIVAAVAVVAVIVIIVAVVLVAPATVTLATFVIALAVVSTMFLAIDVGLCVTSRRREVSEVNVGLKRVKAEVDFDENYECLV